MQHYNVHSHVFTMSNAPKKFLHLYLPGLAADAIDKITDSKAGAWTIEKILMTVGGNGGKRYASFLKIGKSKNQLEVFMDLMNQYRDDPTMKFIALTMDMEKCGAGPSESGYEGQIEEVLTIKKQFPDQLLLFLGVDPRWKTSGVELRDKVRSYFENKLQVNESKSVFPFVGLKIYPSMGFYPFDVRLKETFEWAAENRVPVLSHCNFLGGIYNNDETYIDGIINAVDPYNNNAAYPAQGVDYKKQKSQWKWILGRQRADNNLNRCSYFMEPNAFDTMMDSFQKSGKPLKICLAHFGGGNQISASLKPGSASQEEKEPYGVLQKNWYLQVQEMMKNYTSLYTDISYALHDTDIHGELIKQIQNKDFGDRIMFGTDFFLTEREGPELDTYRKFKKKAVETPVSAGITAWDKVAGTSTAKFLESNFFQPT